MSRKNEENIGHRDNPEYNPCLEESIMSLKCLQENQQNRDACKLYFENYKLCNNFWNKVRKERRRQGIEPELPPTEMRNEVLDKMFKKK